MKWANIFAIGAAVAIAAVGAAQAGDAAGSSKTRTGIYIGAHAGAMMGDVNYAEPGYQDTNISPDADGFMGGALIGYNYQMDALLLGLEGDLGFGSADVGPDANSLINTYSAFSVDWNAHVRARLGYSVGSTLFFVAGGVSMLGLTVDDMDPGYGKDSDIHTGWTVGAGVERPITETLTLRFEYMYDDYGSGKYHLTDGSGPYDAKVDLTAHTVRAALAYRF